MKILQVGLGSMGKRRIRNLLTLGVSPKQIFGVDTNPSRRSETQTLFNITTYADFQRAVKKENPDAYIISTPPDKHSPFFLHAAKHGKHFFVEIGTTLKGYHELFPLLDKSIVAAPSCAYRFYQPIKKIKTILETSSLGKILFFIHHMGQYLPNWHPYEDYRTFYAGKKESSALDEMFLFETNWLSWLINDTFKKGVMTSSKQSNLKIETNDLSITTFQSSRGIQGNLIIDLLSKPARRSLSIICDHGTIQWEWQEKTIRIFTEKQKRWKTYHLFSEKHHHHYLADERMYEDEMKAFLQAIERKKPFPYTFQEEYEHLKLLAEAKKKYHDN